jgi:hypothetical protein
MKQQKTGISPQVFAVVLVVGMPLLLEIGHYFGKALSKRI